MAFITNSRTTIREEEAIERVHELLVNDLHWDPDEFEVRPSDPYANENILIKQLDEPIDW
jgi:hypothetical protein